MSLTNKFVESLAAEIEKAGPRIKAVLEEKVCKSETEERLIIDWIIQLYYPQFQKGIGFNKETVALWPATSEARAIMKKLEFLTPGLTQFVDSDGTVQNRGLVHKLVKRFENDKASRKLELKIQGNLIHSVTL